VTAWDDRQGLAHPVDPDDWQWQKQAACAGGDVDMFFLGEGRATGKLRAIRRICAECPVWLDCLQFATFVMPQEFGVWAGASTTDRTQLRDGTMTVDEMWDTVLSCSIGEREGTV
jgi:hypothetical protein